jgi:hypothetical protein
VDGGLLAECETHGRRFLASGEPAALEAALEAFAAVPASVPQRPRMAADLVAVMVKAPGPRSGDEIRRMVELAEVAGQSRHPDPDWPATAATVRALDLLVAVTSGRPGVTARQAQTEVERLAALVGENHPYRPVIDRARLGIRGVVGAHDRDAAAARRLVEETRRMTAQAAPGSPDRIRMEALSQLMEGYGRVERGDLKGALASLDKARVRAADLPPSDPARPEIEQIVASLGPLLRSGLPGDDDQITALRSLADAPGLSDIERAMRLGNLGSRLLETDSGTRTGVERAIAALEQAVDLSPSHDPNRSQHLMTAGMAYVRIHDLAEDRAALRRGTALLEEAREAAGTVAHAYWTQAALPLAHAYRMAGRMELGRRTAMTALRGYAWGALLQSDPAEVSNAARSAAHDAIAIARMCLTDSDAAAAATALDAGRGLMLYAATETRNLTGRLEASGHQRLAREWREEVARVGVTEAAPELRRRVIAAVAGIPLDADGTMLSSPASGSARRLDPPSLDEVRAALTALELDALVYLMPGDKGPGAAVVVARSNEPVAFALPGLGETPEFDRLVIAGVDRRREIAAQDAAEGHLEGVCAWAWRVAIGPLLEHGIEPPDGRPPRIVLVPMRELALVPWHAASRLVGGRPRYAVEDAVFSYATSARLLCDAAWAPPVSTVDGGLFVGDPDAGENVADLPDARAEALAVRAAFYPGARYVGRGSDDDAAADGAGTRQDVLTWLADPAGGGLLHLACHGVVRAGDVGGPHSGESYLALAGGDRLGAGELLRRATADGGRPIGLVVLAACRSGVPARGYDEAFSLATTFLAGGVGSVISAQWSVPDAPTSVLMFMFHHFLRHEHMRPVDALRAAQLWMLAGDDEPPASMPNRLRESCGARSEIAAWAGFTHAGR